MGGHDSSSFEDSKKVVNVFTKPNTNYLITKSHRPGLSKLKEQDSSTDLILIVGAAQETYRVHRDVLIKQCIYFDKSVPLPFSSNPKDRTILEVPELDETVFPDVLEILYSGKFPRIDDIRQTARVFAMAHLLEAREVVQLATDEFCRRIMEPKFCVRNTDQTDEVSWGTVHEGVYYDDLRWLRFSFKTMMTVYNPKEQNLFWRIFGVLSQKGILGHMLAARDMRRFLKDNWEAGLAILDFYARNDSPRQEWDPTRLKAKL